MDHRYKQLLKWYIIHTASESRYVRQSVVINYSLENAPNCEACVCVCVREAVRVYTAFHTIWTFKLCVIFNGITITCKF